MCPLQILGQALTVLVDMPTSNPDKDNDCPYWCPVQILGNTMTVPTDLPSSNP